MRNNLRGTCRRLLDDGILLYGARHRQNDIPAVEALRRGNDGMVPAHILVCEGTHIFVGSFHTSIPSEIRSFQRWLCLAEGRGLQAPEWQDSKDGRRCGREAPPTMPTTMGAVLIPGLDRCSREMTLVVHTMAQTRRSTVPCPWNLPMVSLPFLNPIIYNSRQR